MQNTVEHDEETPSESEGLIKTPRQLIITVILAFLVPIIAIIMLVKLASITSLMGAGSTAQSTEAIAQRIQPVAAFKLVDADAPVETKTGEQVYESTCAACHSSGAAGAPKIGDNDGWAPLIDSGFDEMFRIAIEGKGAMPPRGGNASLSDLEVARAVVYMANQSGGSLEEPSEDSATGDTAADSDADAADKADTAESKPADTADADAAPNADAEQADATPDTADDQGAEQAQGVAGQRSSEDTGDASDTSDQADAAPAEGTAAEDDNAAADKDAASKDETATAQDGDADADATQAAAADTDSGEIDPAGEKLYKSVCFACHTTGAAGAPKIGSKEDWAPYVEAGFDTMLEKAITGVGAMPPRGGSQASDEEMKASIQYILSTLE